MPRTAALLLLAGSASAVSLGRGFLKSDMRPDVVARTLEKVEQEWRSQAAMFAECNAAQGSDFESDCSSAPKAFQKSCTTVVSAVVRSSSGDRGIVNEYMNDICAENVLTGWKKVTCKSLSALVYNAMTADDYGNRVEMQPDVPCTKFWGQFQADEKVRIEKEKAEQAEEEKKQAEEQAELDKKAAEDRKAAEEVLKEQQKQQEELKAAEAAKEKAQDADTQLEEQKAAAVIEADAAAKTPVAAVASDSAEVSTAKVTFNTTANVTNATVVSVKNATVTNATKANATNATAVKTA